MEIEALAARYSISVTALPGMAPVCKAEICAQDWLRIAQIVRAEGGRLISLWGTDKRPPVDQWIMSAAYCVAEGLLWLRLPVSEQEGYPDLSAVFPSAVRMQRTAFDLLG